MVTIFLLSIVFIKLLIKHSSRLGLIDMPNARSAHKQAMPKSAGLGFVGAVIIAKLLVDPVDIYHHIFIYVAILVVMLIGLYDDKNNVKPRTKFIVLIVAAIIVIFNGIHINTLGNYFGFNLTIPFYISAIFTMIAIVGFTNALNLMDGLDGLAGGLSIIIMSIFFTIGLIYHDEFMVSLSSSFIIAVAAFLIFNWNPAKIFMGDSGSLTLGFVIAILAIKSSEYIPPASVLFIVGLPLIDTFNVIFRRLQRGQSPFIADKNHIHHFLYKTKLHIRFSVMMLLLIQLALSIIGYQMKNTDQILSLILFAIILYIFINLFDQRYKYRPKNKQVKRLK